MARSDQAILTDEQRRDWLRLIRTQRIGPATFRDLINHFGGARAALENLPQLTIASGRNVEIFTVQDADAELAAAEALGAQLVVHGERGFPDLLGQTDPPPPLLYVKGNLDLAERPTVAIVGSRSCSAAGRKLAQILAHDLAASGFLIASGLARGIDAAAHYGSLESGTAAVLAGGIDIPYQDNEELHAEIGRRGLLVTERPPGCVPRGKDFPRRNRLISGMALGVIVIEAAKRSGSLITARMAGEQGRELMAIPGHPLDARAEGTNALIRDGATLVRSAEDVLEALRPMLKVPKPRPPRLRESPPAEVTGPVTADGGDRASVLEALGTTPIAIDELVRATGLEPRVVGIVLIELDLAGRLERHGAQLVSLRPV